MSCSGLETCRFSTITGPVYGDFNFQNLGGSRTIYSTVIDASNMITGAFNAQFTGSANYRFTVKCPGNSNECTIFCTASSHGCAQMTLQSQNHTKLSITATGSGALRSSRVFCPLKRGTCAIIASGAGPDLISDLIVYSVDGLASPLFDLQCNYDTDASNCYSEALPPRIACGSALDIVSELYLNSGTTYWKHVWGVNEALICNDNMQSGWYGKRFENTARSLNIFCVDGEDCIMRCTTEKCGGSKIYGPSTGHLLLECLGTGRQSCDGVTVTGPTTSDFNMSCVGTESCRQSAITGPINGDFNFINFGGTRG
eukprot:1311_1